MTSRESPSVLKTLRKRLARRSLQLALALFLASWIPTLLAVWGERQAAANAAWHSPIDDVATAAVAPDLALLSLAGAADDQVLTLAVEKGELATAHALLVFSPALTDAERVNGWLWLAQRYQEVGQGKQAAEAYRLAGTGAVLSADLTDLSRTQTLLAVGKQLTELHDRSSARFYLRQGALIGAYAPQLSAYHRRALLQRLLPVLVRAGGDRDDWKALSTAVKNGNPRGGFVGSPRPTDGQGWPGVAVGNDPGLLAAREARRGAVGALIAAVAPDSGSSPALKEEARGLLRQALLAEDAAVDRYFAQTGGADGGDLTAQQIRLHWLLLKRWVAAEGFGVSLVPEWSSQVGSIEAGLTGAWMRWLDLQAPAAGSALAGPFAGLPAYTARQAIVAAYWGLFPDAPVEELVPVAQVMGGLGRLHLTTLKAGRPPVVGWSE